MKKDAKHNIIGMKNEIHDRTAVNVSDHNEGNGKNMKKSVPLIAVLLVFLIGVGVLAYPLISAKTHRPHVPTAVPSVPATPRKGTCTMMTPIAAINFQKSKK